MIRKYFLAGVSAFAIAGSGAVFAQQQPAAQPGAQPGVEAQTQVVPGGAASETEKRGYDLQPDRPATDMQHTPRSTDPTVRDGVGPQAGTMHKADEAGYHQSYGSYQHDRAAYSGEMRRGGVAVTDTTPDDLVGSTVFDSEGNAVGQVSDLLIGPDGNIDSVIVDAGGFLGMGERHVAMNLDHIQIGRDAGGAPSLSTQLDRAGVEGMPEYLRRDQVWLRPGQSVQ